MSVKTKAYLKKPSESSYSFIGGIENFTLPSFEATYEEYINQGGSGVAYHAPTGITKATGGSFDLYWDNRAPDKQKATHLQLLEAVSASAMQTFRIVFPSGWRWTFHAFVSKFEPLHKKDGKDRAKVSLLPHGFPTWTTGAAMAEDGDTYDDSEMDDETELK